MEKLPPIRRIVTGQDAAGVSVISQDRSAPSFVIQGVPGTTFHEVWNTQGTPALLGAIPDPAGGSPQLAPPSRGSRIRFVDIPPDSVQTAISAEQAAAAFAAIGAPHAVDGGANSRHRLMHKTQTLDYGIVIAGEIWLVLDDAEVKLTAGDVVIQRGTNHAWSNRTESMVRMAFILLDAS